jgi:hypothetical protein
MELLMTELHPHPVSPRARLLHSRRQHLLVGCAFGAMLAWSAHGDRASAQAFQLNDANPNLVAGSVDFSRDVVSTPGTETITVNSPTAIINWNRAEADFLPQGNVATFQNGAGLTDFAVLNRISSLDGGAVAFNGTVLSQINGNPGGTLLFQSAGGIILGATALFDVGNLVLTTLQVGTVDESGYGPYFDPADLRLCCANSPFDQAIVTEAGARIRAANEGSFVVLAAPRVIHGGNTYVNGTSVYFGGEGVSYTINNGLFDIVIDAGSDGNLNPIVHTGTTTGPASTGANDPHAIYMVAAPFSSGDAITMLVGGQVGFEGAAIDNGEIVLSAGFDIEAGQIVDNIDRSAISSKYAESSIRITGGTFTSDVTGRATQDAIAVSDDGALSFSGDLNLVAYNNARLSATNGDVSVAGAVGLTSLGALEFGYGNSALAIIGPLALDVTGGEAAITAENGNSVVISGDATLDASAVGDFDDVDDLNAGFGQGGDTRVEVDSTGGQITFQADLAMNATGTGAADARTPDTGGDGFGGSATIRALAGEIVVDGGVAIDVRGTGTGGATSAGQGIGGGASIGAAGGNVRIAGATTIDTRGTGGAILGTPAGGTVGGEGRGGFVSISADGGDEVSFGTSTSIDARGLGGTGAAGGAGNGGSVGLSTGFGTGGRILAGTTFGVDASGTGGAGLGGDGGAGTGGGVGFTASATGGLIGGSTNVTITSNGTGGIGTVAPAGGPTVGGAGRGGDVSFVAQNDDGAIQLGNVSVSSTGTGGAGFDGGAGAGGDVFAGTEAGYGSTGVPSNAAFGNLDFVADGTGGTGSRNGGTGTGGSARIEAGAGQVSFGGASNLSARGTGGAAGSQAGGAGQGGNVGIRAATGQTVLASAGNTVLDASGIGGQGGTGLGTGGLGQGGTASIDTIGGTLTLSGNFALSADGTGGVSSPDVPPVGIGGNGQGGQAYVQAISNGQITLGATDLSATGTGGAGILGGNGTGGRNEISGISGGQVTAGNVTAAADGVGGDGRDTQNGGAGTGGLVRLVAEADGGAIALGDVTATARGTGGDGGAAGGAGDGGDLFAGTELGYGGTGSTATATYGNISLDGAGTGGSGATGGAGSGGTVELRAEVGQVAFGGNSSLLAEGRGGNASTGTGGSGTGGFVQIQARADGRGQGTAGTARLSTAGRGGNGTVGGAGTGGTTRVGADGVDSTATGATLAFAGGIEVDASGFGGNGTTGAGGNGSGGLVDVFVDGFDTIGGTLSFASAALTSDGTGGSGATGGIGRGGVSPDPQTELESGAFLSSVNGTITGGSASVSAGGTGGAGTAGAGGDGFGGTAQIVAVNSTSGELNDITPTVITLTSGGVDVSARGGSGGTLASGAGAAGGNATAGTNGLALAETLTGSLTISGTLTATADATGGAGGAGTTGTGGRGGNAAAGFVQVGTASGLGTGVTDGDATFGTVQGTASATGGAGGANGGAGGDGAGGALALLARGGTLETGSVTFAVNGTGGAGNGAAAGGTGTGGEAGALLTARSGTTDGAAVTVGAFTARSAGIGGAGGTAGASQYGRTFVDVAGSTADFGSIDLATEGSSAPSDPALAQPVLIRATDSFLGVSGTLTVNSARSVDVIADDGTISAGTASISAPDTILLGAFATGVIAGGDWGLNGGTVSVFHDGRAADAFTVDVASLSAAGQTIDFGAETAVRASDTMLIDAAGTASLSGLLSGGAIEVRGDDIDIAGADGASIDLDAVDELSAGDLVATGDIIFAAGGAASFDSVDAGGRFAGSAATVTVPAATAAVVDLTVTGGATQLGTVAGTTSLTINTSGDATFDTLTGGSVTVASSGGAVTGTSATGTSLAFNAASDVAVGSASASGDVTFQAGGAASFDSVDAGGRFAGSAATVTVPDATAAVVDLAATGGSAELGTVAGTTSLTVNATGTVTFDALTGGNVTLASSGGSIVGASASGTIVDFDAAQTASFTGTIVGNEIQVTSRDIAIGDSARLGGANTQLVRLEARPGQQVFIGGNAQGQGYTLTNAEAGRIRTAALEISARATGSGASRPPDLVVRDLTLNAAPAPTEAGVGTLAITLAAGEGAPGILSVEGALAMNNAGASNGITLAAAGGRVQIVNPQGSIRVLGSGGLPAGNLEIEAANIWSASQGLIDQLVADPAFAGRDDALRTNSGATAERGYIEGGEILMRVGNSLLVQNSGTADEFAGITVVQNTLTIEPTASGQIDVFAFGRRINADGTFVINSPYFREVEFGDRSRYLAPARFNNCTIATGACSGDVPPGLPVGSEVIEGPVEETEESVPPPNPDRQEFVDVSFATESLLEEPVTSGGDSGVWDGEDGDCPPGEVCEPGGGGNP